MISFSWSNLEDIELIFRLPITILFVFLIFMPLSRLWAFSSLLLPEKSSSEHKFFSEPVFSLRSISEPAHTFLSFLSSTLKTIALSSFHKASSNCL